MTQIKVILTKTKAITTFYKTIHAWEVYHGDACETDRYNDRAAQICRSLAFSLACTSPSALCECVDWTDRDATKEEVFEYLNKCHPNG